ncbi:MAG: DUF2357 domain-containing protein [Bacilli bacterium]|nr:DUF2357 domain-containing protein [Bacilli bacterium]
MEELQIINLYNNTPNSKIEKFQKQVNSTLKIVDDYEKVTSDTEWIDIMEDTIRYLDNILRNPNRFIINEEDIVKIELARRVTVESIKHLSRNTNLIQDYDKKTGDVKPSKILNINKEESYNTYENRFIYSLIQNMKSFIARKKSMGVVDSSMKSNKVFEYVGKANMGDEEVNISMNLASASGNNSNPVASKVKGKGETVAERIEKLELRISDLTNSEVYKTIHKLHISLVTSPIKKTNVILKNVNFQYAVKLWNYMQEHLDDNTATESDKLDYEDEGELKDYADETFLLNYLIMDTLNKEESEPDEENEISKKIVENMVKQVVTLNTEITLTDLNKIVEKQYEVIKYQQVATAKKIEEIFNKNIDKYLEKVENLKL